MYLRSNRKLTALLVLFTIMVANLAMAGAPVVHGIISQGYLKSTEYNYLIPSKEGSFAFNEAMINVSATVSDNLRVGAQMIARNLGSDGNEDFVLDWAYGDYRFRDEFGLRVGKVKTPHGLYNQTRDVDMVRNSILLPQAVYTELMRDVMNGFEGISAYGTISIGESSSLEYDAFIGTVDVERTQFPVDLLLQPTFASMWGTALPMAGWRAEVEKIYGGALRYNTPLDGFRVGASAFDAKMYATGSFVAPLGFFNPEFKMHASPWYVLSAEYSTDRLVASFEYTRAFVDMELNGVLVPTGMPDPAPPAVVMDFAPEDRRGGYYGQATWQFNDWFQLGSYYSMYYPDYDTRDAEGFSHMMRDLALTVRFDITDYWLIKLEGHAMNGTGDVRTHMNPGSALAEENWTLFGAKSTFYF